MKKFLLFILINIFLICNANAITLIEAIKEAYDNNPKLNAERENLKISKENINISKSNFYLLLQFQDIRAQKIHLN